MKKQAFLTWTFILITGFAFQTLAQTGTESLLKTKTRSNQSNDRSVAQNDESRTIKVKSTSSGVEITFMQAVVSPRDAASGQATGKRQHKPYVISKNYDKSSPQLAKSGGGAGKVSVSDLSITVTSKGRTQKLAVVNGTATLPEDCDDDDCDLVVSWSWGQTNSGSVSRYEVPVKLTLQDGVCIAIKEKATAASGN